MVLVLSMRVAFGMVVGRGRVGKAARPPGSDPGGLGARCLTLVLRQALSEPSGGTLGVRGGLEGDGLEI
jgi:hypothetical protein